MAALIKDSTFTLLSPGSVDTPGEDWGGTPDTDTGYADTGITVGGHLSTPSGSAAVTQAGSGVTYQGRLICDPTPQLTEGMRIRDNYDGQVYDVLDAITRPGFIPCTEAQLSRSIASS